MMQNNAGTKIFSYIVKDLVGDVLYWPVWWYTTGLLDSFFTMLDSAKVANDELGLTIWIKNIFVPMYGDYSREGRIISFFMRLVIIIGRSFLFIGWLVFSLICFIIWLILPLFIVYQILFNLNIFSF